MKIGIDLDDTICRTTEKVHMLLEEYGQKRKKSPIEIMNNELEKEEFLAKYLGEIYQTVEIKRTVGDVLRRLKNKGNELYIITARSSFSPTGQDIEEITKDWLVKNHILVDGLLMNCYGEEKAKVCRENKIDLMIDDDPYNYQKITIQGIKCILFDDRGRYILDEDCLTSWSDIEKYIERNH